MRLPALCFKGQKAQTQRAPLLYPSRSLPGPRRTASDTKPTPTIYTYHNAPAPQGRFSLCLSLPGIYLACRQRASVPSPQSSGRTSPVTAGRDVRRWCQVLPDPPSPVLPDSTPSLPSLVVSRKPLIERMLRKQLFIYQLIAYHILFPRRPLSFMLSSG